MEMRVRVGELVEMSLGLGYDGRARIIGKKGIT
jgi:hypothetical protein